jgi:hypothetical protein
VIIVKKKVYVADIWEMRLNKAKSTIEAYDRTVVGRLIIGVLE